MLVNREDSARFQDLTGYVRSSGGEVALEIPPAGFIAAVDSRTEERLAKDGSVSVVTDGPLANVPSTSLPAAGIAAAAWNSRFEPAGGSDEHEHPQTGPGQGARDGLPPPPGQGQGVAAVPGQFQTTEFMAGSIAYSVVFLESNGGSGNCSPADPQTENWSAPRRSQVLAELAAGMSFWTSRQSRPGPLTFIQDDRGVAFTSCEPISRSSEDDSKWIADAMNYLGFPTTPANAWSTVRAFDHARRTALGTDWAFTVFMVDSLNDADGTFSNGLSGYAYLNGPYTVMTYENGGWGIDRLNLVTAHETGHIFGALDEYSESGCSTSSSSGYLNSQNTSCNNGGITSDISMMGPGVELEHPAVDVSVSARKAIGWRNPSNGGTAAVVDVVRTATTSLTAYTPDPTSDPTPTYSGVAGNVAFPPEGFASPVVVSRVAGVEFSIDGGSFAAATAVDGTFNEEWEDYTFTTQPLPAGTHTIAVRSTNHFGHQSSVVTDTLSIGDVIPPPANDELNGRYPIVNGAPAYVQDTTLATVAGYDPFHSCTGGIDSNSVWFQFTAGSGIVVLDTFGSNYDTVLALYDEDLNELACSDDVGGLQSEVSFSASAGQAYIVEVSDFGGPNGGNLVLNLSGPVGPDLVIDEINVSPSFPQPGQPANVDVHVRNSGYPGTGSFWVDFYADRDSAPGPFEIGDFSCNFSGLAVGATQICSGTFTYGVDGIYDAWAQVDTDQQVAEFDETNNNLPQPILVATPAELVIESVTPDSTTVVEGQTFGVAVAIRNLGGDTINPYYVDVYRHLNSPPGVAVGDHTCLLGPLGPGAMDVCNVVASYEAPGNYSLWAQVDMDGFVAETNEANNVFGPLAMTVMADADSDGDGVMDSSDNCPAWANGSQTLPSWFVPPDDPDCDGFPTAAETFAETNPLGHCAATTQRIDEPGADQWAADFDDNQLANLLDLIVYADSLNTADGNPDYTRRADLNGSGVINLLDLVPYATMLNTRCDGP